MDMEDWRSRAIVLLEMDFDFYFHFYFFERKEILLELERSGVTILSLVNSCDCVLGISFFIVFVFYSFFGFLSTIYICVWE